MSQDTPEHLQLPGLEFKESLKSVSGLTSLIVSLTASKVPTERSSLKTP